MRLEQEVERCATTAEAGLGVVKRRVRLELETKQARRSRGTGEELPLETAADLIVWQV